MCYYMKLYFARGQHNTVSNQTESQHTPETHYVHNLNTFTDRKVKTNEKHKTSPSRYAFEMVHTHENRTQRKIVYKVHEKFKQA